MYGRKGNDICTDVTCSELELSGDGETLAIADRSSQAMWYLQYNIGKVTIYRYENNNWIQHGSPIYGEFAQDQRCKMSLSDNAKSWRLEQLSMIVTATTPEGYDMGHVRIYQYRDDWYKMGLIFMGLLNTIGRSVELSSMD